VYGGTGRTFDWSLARGARRPVILAGGLDETNVRQAIEAAQPWGVDACSRLEGAPGRKDRGKLARFLEAARS
jgi:phosphoribosylanthranilate isomerase